jgi:hypothetical protein
MPAFIRSQNRKSVFRLSSTIRLKNLFRQVQKRILQINGGAEKRSV